MTKTLSLALLCAAAAQAHTLIPQPQSVELTSEEFQIGANWRIAGDSTAAAVLKEELATRSHLRLIPAAPGGTIQLTIQPGSVEVGEALDKDKNVLAEEAYRIELAPREVRITANAAAGLFYGVETLAQLLDGGTKLPQGKIVDWPDLQYRAIYWDDAHHLDHVDYLKRALRQAAFYKINAFIVKWEGHFQFKSAPALVEPYALSPAQLQELTDYGLKYHVQLIPYLDGPAHIAFILKHPEYAGIREYPNNNYELCATNPDSYKLLRGMYQDLVEANKGVKYFYLSTDESYYIGKTDNAQCHEGERAKELGTVGKMLAEFVTKAGAYLHDSGRTVVFWGEFPMVVGDIPSLPKYLVNGETYGRGFDAAFQANGIREEVYVSTQGEERMFPDYFILPTERRMHRGAQSRVGRVQEASRMVVTNPARKDNDLMGVNLAAWADAGLHTETFWLGYAAISAAAWNPREKPEEAMDSFYPLFYGPSAKDMARLYQLMSYQAQSYADSWEPSESKNTKPILGNSRGIFDTPHPRNDQTIPLPAVGSATWSQDNAKRLDLAAQSLKENDELLALIDSNVKSVELNRYNLEVFRSIAQLYRQNLEMLAQMGRIDAALQAAGGQEPKQAVASLDQALDMARAIRASRNGALHQAETVWYQTWYPRVAQANGRKFLHELDDVKDHPPDRTVDLSYLVYRELQLPMDDWYDHLLAARNERAKAAGMAARTGHLNWAATTSPALPTARTKR